MLLNWDHIAHSLSQNFKGNGYKLALVRGIRFLRNEIGPNSELRIFLGVEGQFQKALLESSLMRELVEAIEVEVSSPFTIQIEITGAQTELPISVTDPKVKRESNLIRLNSEKPTSFSEIRPTFEDFVAGSENEIALRASQRFVAGEPSPMLVFYGPTGSGKSHLLASISQAVSKAAKVRFVSGSEFLADFVDSIRNKQMQRFNKKYRYDLELLLLDDLSPLKTAKKTQEELIGIFDALLLQRKKVIVSTPVVPTDLRGFSDAFISRLSAGLWIELKAPGQELRTKILESFSRKLGVEVEEGTLSSIAAALRSDGRALNGAIHKLHFMFGRNRKIQRDEAFQVLGLESGPQLDSVDTIIEHIERKFGVARKELLSQSRIRSICEARNQAMWLLRSRLGMSFSEIGRALGHRDSSTVQHGIKRIIGIKDKV